MSVFITDADFGIAVERVQRAMHEAYPRNFGVSAEIPQLDVLIARELERRQREAPPHAIRLEITLQESEWPHYFQLRGGLTQAQAKRAATGLSKEIAEGDRRQGVVKRRGTVYRAHPSRLRVWLMDNAPAAPVPKPWSMADRKRAWTALDSWRLSMSGVGRRVPAPTDPEIQRKAAIWGIAQLVAINEDYARKNRETAEHFRTHPAVYGDSTPAMIAKFKQHADENDRDAERGRKLIARLEADGIMPPAPDDYKP